MSTLIINQPAESKKIITGRDELNICEWPLGALRYNKSLEGDYAETFSDYIQGRNGQWIKREWGIVCPQKYGRPTAQTDDVLIALMEITKEASDFKERRVPVSKAMIIEKMFCRNSEKNACDIDSYYWNAVENEMLKLKGVMIEARNAFYLKEQDKYIKLLAFGMLDDFGFMDEKRGRRGPQMVMPFGWFTWNDILFRSLKAGFIKKLDTDLYYSLESDKSRRLFRLLDKMAYRYSHYKFDLLTLCCEKLGMSRSYTKPSRYKTELEDCNNELREKGIIEGVEFGKEFSSFFNQERWIVNYHFPRKEERFTEQEKVALNNGVSENEVIISRFDLPKDQEQLVRWVIAQDPGQVAAEIAIEIIKNSPHNPDMMEVIATDFSKRKRQGQIRDPIGWLRKTLSDPHYRRPKGLKTRTDEKREEQARQEAEQRRYEETMLKARYDDYIEGEIDNYKKANPEGWQELYQRELNKVVRENSFFRQLLEKDPKAIEGTIIKRSVEGACYSILKQTLSLLSFEKWLEINKTV